MLEESGVNGRIVFLFPVYAEWTNQFLPDSIFPFIARWKWRVATAITDYRRRRGCYFVTLDPQSPQIVKLGQVNSSSETAAFLKETAAYITPAVHFPFHENTKTHFPSLGFYFARFKIHIKVVQFNTWQDFCRLDGNKSLWKIMWLQAIFNQ